MRYDFIVLSLLWLIAVPLLALYIDPRFWWLYLLVVPFSLWGYYDMWQKKHTILRNFPVVGHVRYWMEWLRPKVYQYFIESDWDGRPFHRMFRSIVYQRAKGAIDTVPFGTQYDVYAEGYEWMMHSVCPTDPNTLDHDPRICIGGPQCRHPYRASIFNISAMSFGALSKPAIEALNGGAHKGGFYHNTGEGGVSPYHLKYGADLVWQIGTGYFGCRTPDGRFDAEMFKDTAAHPSIKMIELKLSQGAKPGHGGILPAVKVTPEIAKIRGLEPYKTVYSPPYHREFSTPVGLLEFLQRLRELSGGKPVGFKLCVGDPVDFLSICLAMHRTGILPDYIAVDGGEGGTGAAPLEFANSVGMPLREGLAFVDDALRGFGLRKHIRIVASGKIVTGFHVVRSIALGADLCASARGMMMALGCIQALECNKNTCPVGITTHDPELTYGLVVEDKIQRVYRYHRETIDAVVELIAAAGLRSTDQISRHHIYRRTHMDKILCYRDIYPPLQHNELLSRSTVPPSWQQWMEAANPDNFRSTLSS